MWRVLSDEVEDGSELCIFEADAWRRAPSRNMQELSQKTESLPWVAAVYQTCLIPEGWAYSQVRTVRNFVAANPTLKSLFLVLLRLQDFCGADDDRNFTQG